MKSRALVANIKDNVATAIDDIKVGERIFIKSGESKIEVDIIQNIPFGHKFAIEEIVKGNEVVKYGEKIGAATSDIKVGEHAHIHNVESNRGRGDRKRRGEVQA